MSRANSKRKRFEQRQRGNTAQRDNGTNNSESESKIRLDSAETELE